MRAALVISDRDNVATALEPLEKGRELLLDGRPLVTIEPIPSGHKVALRGISQGESVIKYGCPIGLATCDIRSGAHVHTHNVASSRGRGDLDSAAAPPQPRLAEPAESLADAPGSTAEPPARLRNPL